MINIHRTGPPQYYEGKLDGPLRVVESIHARICQPDTTFAVDPLAVSQMVAGSGPLGGRTLVEGIRRLQPGERLRADGYGLALAQGDDWYAVEPDTDDPPALRETLREAIRGLPQQPPLISLLSGGWDSRLLLALAREAGITDRVRAYTTSSDTGTVLEELVAAQVADHLDVFHRIVP